MSTAMQREKLYDRTVNEMADKTGFSHGAFTLWVRKGKLPPHHKKPATRSRVRFGEKGNRAADSDANGALKTSSKKCGEDE